MNSQRRPTRSVWIGKVRVGGDAPVVVQSMTNTDTVDALKTAIQCAELARAGSELVRITVNTPEAAAAVPRIREQLDKMGVDVPLIGDFHYNGHRLLTDYPECAQVLAKYRINPGNVGHGKKRDEQFAQMIEIACRYDKPVRIGVNWGSLDQDLLARIMDGNASRAEPLDAVGVMREAMVASALESAAKAEELGLPGDRIILSCKVSGVQDLIAIYRALSRRSDYPLHLGLTEAGMGSKGIVASTAAMKRDSSRKPPCRAYQSASSSRSRRAESRQWIGFTYFCLPCPARCRARWRILSKKSGSCGVAGPEAMPSAINWRRNSADLARWRWRTRSRM